MMAKIINPGDINLWATMSFDRKTKQHWVEVLHAVDNFPNAEEFSFTAIETIGPIVKIEAAIRVFWKQYMDRKIADSKSPNPPIEEEHDNR